MTYSVSWPCRPWTLTYVDVQQGPLRRASFNGHSPPGLLHVMGSGLPLHTWTVLCLSPHERRDARIAPTPRLLWTLAPQPPGGLGFRSSPDHQAGAAGSAAAARGMLRGRAPGSRTTAGSQQQAHGSLLRILTKHNRLHCVPKVTLLLLEGTAVVFFLERTVRSSCPQAGSAAFPHAQGTGYTGKPPCGHLTQTSQTVPTWQKQAAWKQHSQEDVPQG